MKKLLLLTTILLASCGASVDVKDSNHTGTIDGEVYSYVIVKMEFIESIRQICNDLYLANDFANDELYRQQVAQCTIDNLSILDLDAISQFNDQFCDNPQTQEEINICNALN